MLDATMMNGTEISTMMSMAESTLTIIMIISVVAWYLD